MKKLKILLLGTFAISMFFVTSCEKDPVIIPEKEVVETQVIVDGNIFKKSTTLPNVVFDNQIEIILIAGTNSSVLNYSYEITPKIIKSVNGDSGSLEPGDTLTVKITREEWKDWSGFIQLGDIDIKITPWSPEEAFVLYKNEIYTSSIFLEEEVNIGDTVRFSTYSPNKENVKYGYFVNLFYLPYYMEANSGANYSTKYFIITTDGITDDSGLIPFFYIEVNGIRLTVNNNSSEFDGILQESFIEYAGNRYFDDIVIEDLLLMGDTAKFNVFSPDANGIGQLNYSICSSSGFYVLNNMSSNSLHYRQIEVPLTQGNVLDTVNYVGVNAAGITLTVKNPEATLVPYLKYEETVITHDLTTIEDFGSVFSVELVNPLLGNTNIIGPYSVFQYNANGIVSGESGTLNTKFYTYTKIIDSTTTKIVVNAMGIEFIVIKQ
jgi:hypothetical protein